MDKNVESMRCMADVEEGRTPITTSQLSKDYICRITLAAVHLVGGGIVYIVDDKNLVTEANKLFLRKVVDNLKKQSYCQHIEGYFTYGNTTIILRHIASIELYEDDVPYCHTSPDGENKRNANYAELFLDWSDDFEGSGTPELYTLEDAYKETFKN